MEFKNDLLLRAARGEKTERPPVWVMRQAGRILKEYRAVRGKLSGFKELVETPEAACEVTIQPVDILGVDAAILFSDILVVPEAMGLTYQMIEKKGPWFEKTIRSEGDLSQIRVPDVEDSLSYVYSAIDLLVKELDGRVPLIGFAGAPWTIFAYMVEGSGSKTFSEARKLLVTNPKLSHTLLGLITETTIAYLKGQVKHGVSLVQVFDSWAGILGQEQYAEFALPYVKQITDAITDVPLTYFGKGANQSFNEIKKLNCRTLSLDWTVRPQEIRSIVGAGFTLQGNLDPCTLYGSMSFIEKETQKMLKSFEGGPHIANLGHGVYPDTNPDAVRCFIDTVKSYS
ncbi:MAG: uroporphyrinogen decarboxylase [Sphingobacteriales bacterium]|jgi:uroporphyrinogen decarboxylase